MSGPYQNREHDSKAQVVWHQSSVDKADRAKAKGQV